MCKKILLIEPPKSRKYHTQYPPLGLLKLASYHKLRGDEVRFVRGFADNGFDPDMIYITSLFTYAYEPVHEMIKYYSQKYKKAKIKVGGIYATLCPEHLYKTFGEKIEIHEGLFWEAEDLIPDYSLVPDWDASILFASRGCIRKCHFCSVKRLEPDYIPKKSIRHLIYPGHKKVIFWDNNILASPYWRDIFSELEELNLEVDFNQGIDARLVTEEVALRLKRLKIPLIRLAYDSLGIRKPLKKAIELLKQVGIKGRRILVYCLFNSKDRRDTPENFLERIKDLMEWEVVVYPMRYQELKPKPKDWYVSPRWTKEQLEMIAKARRVMGYSGAFPPHEGLKKKFLEAKTFEEAFSLYPIKRKKHSNRLKFG
jgi:hypothetical protein